MLSVGQLFTLGEAVEDGRSPLLTLPPPSGVPPLPPTRACPMGTPLIHPECLACLSLLPVDPKLELHLTDLNIAKIGEDLRTPGNGN